MKLTHIVLLLFTGFITQAQITFQEIHQPYEDSEIDGIQSLLAADFNNDGILDYCGGNPFQTSIWVGINTENLGRPTFTKVVDDIDMRNIQVADFNEDGNMDIVGADVFGGRFVALLGDGQGGFVESFIPGLVYSGLHFVDLNADGSMEMLFGTGNEFRLYDLNNGDPVLLETLTNSFGLGDPRAFNTFDYNNDGKLDIIAAYSGDILIFQQNTLTDYTQVDIFPDDIFSVSKIAPAKINDDGFWDFYAVNFSVRAIISNAAGAYEVTTLSNGDGQTEGSILGDFDNDGDDDALLIRVEGVNTGTTTIFENDNGTFTTQVLNEEFSNNVAGGTYDFNDDDTEDIYMFSNDFFDAGLLFYVSFIDDDGDGYGVSEDCDDNNPNVNPGASEITYNGIDDDCNPMTLDDDLDQDGFPMAEDCNDNNANVNPDAFEIVYNGYDDDCDPLTLDDDLDEDGFGFVDDCDDNNPNINPDAVEIPDNGIDDDCMDGDLTATINISDTEINFYPNPVKDLLTIELNQSLDFQVDILDVNGRVILSQKNTNSLYLGDQTPGIYFIQFKNLKTAESKSSKILIQ